MNTTTTTAALPSDVEALLRQLRLPHARAIAADVLATARAQRWDPTEVIKALLTEETAGRARSMLASRRKAVVPAAKLPQRLWLELLAKEVQAVRRVRDIGELA